MFFKSHCGNYKRNLYDINFDEMRKMIKVNNPILIDVRSKQEYAENHFDGAINIPLDEITEKITTIVPDKNQLIILYCQTGPRSKKAQNILNRIGYVKVYNLKEGIGGV